MIVADSSIIAEGILADRKLLIKDRILAPDLAIYEAAGAIWKHKVVLGRIEEGESYLALLAELVRTNNLLIVGPDGDLIRSSYEIAERYRVHPHDAVFVALALKTGLRLQTLDSKQRSIFERERRRMARNGPHPGPPAGEEND